MSPCLCVESVQSCSATLPMISGKRLRGRNEIARWQSSLMSAQGTIAPSVISEGSSSRPRDMLTHEPLPEFVVPWAGGEDGRKERQRCGAEKLAVMGRGRSRSQVSRTPAWFCLCGGGNGGGGGMAGLHACSALHFTSLYPATCKSLLWREVFAQLTEQPDQAEGMMVHGTHQ
jgi:hypothetical protein